MEDMEKKRKGNFWFIDLRFVKACFSFPSTKPEGVAMESECNHWKITLSYSELWHVPATAVQGYKEMK